MGMGERVIWSWGLGMGMGVGAGRVLDEFKSVQQY